HFRQTCRRKVADVNRGWFGAAMARRRQGTVLRHQRREAHGRADNVERRRLRPQQAGGAVRAGLGGRTRVCAERRWGPVLDRQGGGRKLVAQPLTVVVNWLAVVKYCGIYLTIEKLAIPQLP